MLEICLEALEGKKLPERKDLRLQTVSASQKAKKKNYPGMENMECVWSLQSPGNVVGKLSAGWTAAESWWAEQEEEEGEAFFSADTLIESRGSREIKAVRRLKERKDGSGSLFCLNKTWVPLVEKCDWTVLCVELNECGQIRLEEHC